MLKAVVHEGHIVPLEPLPPEWKEGTTLEVAPVDSSTIDIDQWTRTMHEVCDGSSGEDEAAMFGAINDHRREAKELIRREMGLAE